MGNHILTQLEGILKEHSFHHDQLPVMEGWANPASQQILFIWPKVLFHILLTLITLTVIVTNLQLLLMRRETSQSMKSQLRPTHPTKITRKVLSI